MKLAPCLIPHIKINPKMEKRPGTRKLLDGNKRQCLGPGPGNDLDVPLKTQSIKAEINRTAPN